MPENFYINTSDNIKLTGINYPVKNPEAVILLVHGLGEFQGRYVHVANAFNEAGFDAVTIDIRGHGYSEGKRGYIPSYDQLMEDMDMVVEHARKISDAPHFIIYGHSMGGNIVANYIIRKKRKDVDGAIISSPWLSLRIKPSIFELAIGRIISRLWPKFTRSNKVNPHILSHDKNVVIDFIENPKVHSKISPKLFFAHRAAGIWALQHAHEVNIPLLVMQSEKDHIVSPDASKKFAERAGATFQLWEGMYHEPHNEIGKEKVIDFMINWIKSNK